MKEIKEIRLAQINDLEQVEYLYNECKVELLRKEIYQWDNYYPNRDYYEDCIKNKEMYVCNEGDKIVGAVVLNEAQSSEWCEIEWCREIKKPLIIHALCIDPHIQGKGYGKLLVDFCEQVAKKNGFDGLRLDTFSQNPISQKLYEKKGFRKQGNVKFLSKPKGYQTYYCYDKVLN